MLERLYITYIPKSWGIIWFASFWFTNAFFWLYEDYIGIEHTTYWYDVVQLMVWILIGSIIFYAGEKSNENFIVKHYIDAKDTIKDSDIVLINKKGY